jgi:ribA/ribD-fused uncharacterized protein
MKNIIREFRGEYKFLSNFWYSKVYLDGKEYSTVEHAYQASKTLDENERKMIRQLASPAEAKKIGLKVILREDWDIIKLIIMEDLIFQKFNNNIKLKRKLLNTKDAVIEEGNYWGDTYWGICNNEGENHLGKILMRVRDKLKNESNIRNKWVSKNNRY